MSRLWAAIAVGIVALVTSGVVATLARAQPGGDPAAVITAYETARNARDVDTALSYFADDAIVTQRSTSYAGRDEIRKYLEAVSSRSRYTVVTDRQTNGNRVSWTERAGGLAPGQQQSGSAQNTSGSQSTGLQGFTIGVEALVQDGKIHSLAYAAGGAVVRTDLAPDGRAQLPASAGLAAVMAMLLGVVVVASLGLRRSPIGASSLRGRMIHDLQGWSAARQ